MPHMRTGRRAKPQPNSTDTHDTRGKRHSMHLHPQGPSPPSPSLSRASDRSHHLLPRRPCTTARREQNLGQCRDSSVLERAAAHRTGSGPPPVLMAPKDLDQEECSPLMIGSPWLLACSDEAPPAARSAAEAVREGLWEGSFLTHSVGV